MLRRPAETLSVSERQPTGEAATEKKPVALGSMPALLLPRVHLQSHNLWVFGILFFFRRGVGVLLSCLPLKSITKLKYVTVGKFSTNAVIIMHRRHLRKGYSGSRNDETPRNPQDPSGLVHAASCKSQQTQNSVREESK